MTRIVWKFSFTLYTSNNESNFWKKYQFWLKIVILVKKTTNRESSKFSKVKFWPKPRIQNSANTKPLNLELLTELTCFIFTSWLEKCFEITENIQKYKCDKVATLLETPGNLRSSCKLLQKQFFFDFPRKSPGKSHGHQVLWFLWVLWSLCCFNVKENGTSKNNV